MREDEQGEVEGARGLSLKQRAPSSISLVTSRRLRVFAGYNLSGYHLM